jgi:hypothetical protein
MLQTYISSLKHIGLKYLPLNQIPEVLHLNQYDRDSKPQLYNLFILMLNLEES